MNTRWRICITTVRLGVFFYEFVFLDSALPFFQAFEEKDSYITNIVATRIPEAA